MLILSFSGSQGIFVVPCPYHRCTCADGLGPCYHQRLRICFYPVLQPDVAMLMSEDHIAIGPIFIWVCWLLPQAIVMFLAECWLTVIPEFTILFQSGSVLISVPGLLLETMGNQGPGSLCTWDLRTGPFPHHSPQGRVDSLSWRRGPSYLGTGEPAPESQWPWENWLYCWLPQRKPWCNPSPCMWER